MPEVLASLAEEFYWPRHQGRVAFGGLVQKLKQLAGLFQKAPQLWEKFKQLVGIQSLTDIPGAVRRLVDLGKRTLHTAMAKLFNTWPLKIYTLEKGKLMSFNDLLMKLLNKSPKLKRLAENGAKAIGDLGETIRKKAPHIIGVVMVAIYIWIWFNVLEFEWDIKALVDAITGALTFPAFLASLPGSALGFLLNALGFGTFTLLPYTIAARILYLLYHRYVEWNGRGFTIDWKKMGQDFGLAPDAAST
jgi:hypothetical protein